MRVAMAVRVGVSVSAVRMLVSVPVAVLGVVSMARGGARIPRQVRVMVPGCDHKVEQVQRYREERDPRVMPEEHETVRVKSQGAIVRF